MHLTTDPQLEARRAKTVEVLKQVTAQAPVAAVIISTDQNGNSVVSCTGSMHEICFLVKSADSFVLDLLSGRIRANEQ